MIVMELIDHDMSDGENEWRDTASHEVEHEHDDTYEHGYEDGIAEAMRMLENAKHSHHTEHH